MAFCDSALFFGLNRARGGVGGSDRALQYRTRAFGTRLHDIDDLRCRLQGNIPLAPPSRTPQTGLLRAALCRIPTQSPAKVGA
jgi:hypothetical protein